MGAPRPTPPAWRVRYQIVRQTGTAEGTAIVWALDAKGAEQSVRESVVRSGGGDLKIIKVAPEPKIGPAGLPFGFGATMYRKGKEKP